MLRKTIISLTIVLLLIVLWGAVAQAGLEGNGDYWGYLPIIRHKFPPLPPPEPPQGMVYIPGGEFTMGCDPAHWQCNVLVTPSNPHAVYVDPFFIDIHEVTVARYNACVLAGVCSLPSNTFSATRPDYFYNPDYVNFPVIYVDWSQAKTFCEWDGGRLPTEAEWEKAARGDQDNRLYAWGNDWIQCALANVTMGTYRCVGDTTMVASYPWGASPYGLKDMVGNTWEWVNDWFDINYYDYSPYNNPQGPDTGTGRIIRGGSWFGNQLDAVSSFRYGLDPNHIDEDLGFRCVVSP